MRRGDDDRPPAAWGRGSSPGSARNSTVDPFNPLLALQTLLTGDAAPSKQRIRAAQQLAEYLRSLPTNAGLLATYEPYVATLAGLLVAPADRDTRSTRELHTQVLGLLQALGGHSPRQASEWLTQRAQPGDERWLVAWGEGLLQEAARRLPRSEDRAHWGDQTIEFLELGAAAARVVHTWRSLLDHAADEDAVRALVEGFSLFAGAAADDQWRAMGIARIQPHFVDVADVLVGWAITAPVASDLRERIVELLQGMGQLWADNSVFSLQLLSSFAEEIAGLSTGLSELEDGDGARVSTLLICFLMVAHHVPDIALSRSELAGSPLERVLHATVSSCTKHEHSDYCVVKCAEYLSALSSSSPTAFSTLSMLAVRFLLLRAALMESRHDIALTTIETVISGVASIVESNFPALLSQPDAGVEVVAILETDITGDRGRPMARTRPTTVLERLFRLHQQFGLQNWTKLLVRLLQIGGLAAMKTVALTCTQWLGEGRLSELDSAYATHCATSFLLACNSLRRRRRRYHPRDEDIVHAQEIAKACALRLVGACSQQPPPRHVQLMAKMWLSLLRANRAVASAVWADPALRTVVPAVLDSASVLLLDATTSSSDLAEDVLRLTHEVIRQVPVQLIASRDTCVKLCSAVSSLAASHVDAVRERGVLLLQELTLKTQALVAADELATKALEFVVDPSREVREAAVWGVLGRVSSGDLASGSSNRESVGRRGRQRRRLPFAASDFGDVFQLLERPASNERDWLALGTRLSDRREVESSNMPPLPTESRPQLLSSVVRQAAEWCVDNRLRTHFGGPAQTFASVERLLIAYAAPKATTPRASEARVLFQTNSKLELGRWMALEFVTALELLIGHACASVSDGLDPESEAYKAWQFYRANKAVCDDWLRRIRPLLVELSSNAPSLELSRLHLYAMVSVTYNKLRRHLQASSGRGASDTLSSDLRAAKGELDATLFALCRCCCDLKDADSIVGFQKWGRVIAAELAKRRSTGGIQNQWSDGAQPPLFGWMTAVRHEACMHYEDAVECYEEQLHPILAAESSITGPTQASILDLFKEPDKHLGMSLATMLGCFRQCAQCYVMLGRWSHIRALARVLIASAAHVAKNATPFPGAQSIVECAQVWTRELELVSLLEAESGDDDTYALQATFGSIGRSGDIRPVPPHFVKRWGFASDWPQALPTDERSTNVHDGVLDRLGQIAFQGGHYDALGSHLVEKKVERLYLEISQASFGKLSATEAALWSDSQALSALDPCVHDSALWSGYALRLRALACRVGSQVTPDEPQWTEILTNAAMLARKQRNFALAGRMLRLAEDTAKSVSLVTPLAVSYEKARLLAAIGPEADGVRILASVCASKVASSGEEHSDSTKESLVKALGRLATSLSTMTTTSPEEVDGFSAVLAPVFSFYGGPADSSRDESTAEISGASVEKCLYVATQVSPTSAKAWFRYSNWCYELGKHGVEQVVAQNGYIHLSPLEELEITAALDEQSVASADRDAIVRGFCHIFDNGAIVPQRSDKFRQLCYDRMSQVPDDETVNDLVALQAAAHARVLRYHLLAADSYRSYLQLQGEEDSDSSTSGSQQQKVMLVALRLLHLLTKYGSEQDIVASIERTFTVGPVAPWTPVVPQLIARAGHPDAAVSSVVCLMLRRLARSYPHLLVYPAVVDSAGADVASDALERSSTGSSSPLAGILDEVRRVSSGLVDGVSLLVSELRRISILWDEAWIAALSKLSTDVDRRTSTLEKESARVAKNTSLSPDDKRELAERKFVAIMKPVLLSLERVWAATCGSAGRFGPLTPHEQHFMRAYGGAIERVQLDLREACIVGRSVDPASFSPQSVRAIWEPLEAILKAMVSAAGRRDRVSLEEISPAILSVAAIFARTNMPGAARGSGVTPKTMVYVHKLLPAVAVLKTKTKPKVLQFVGSDGETHRYLLKAKEDLRLDERVMQFLAAANKLLMADKAAAVRGLNAQNYSVVPISSDAGLIQMVPGVVPLFQIYTAHQEYAGGGKNPQTSPPPTAAGRAPPNPPQPPTVQFYTMLKQHGIHEASQRAKWPLPVLRQVYADLVRQLPRNMIKQELLLRSDDLREGWAKSARLVKSLAVMSVLGYVVGLGDRHLDNILLRADTGEVVHIDYNVCFDKGKTLKVPEIVPFRLTPMLQDALGLTGTEGPFRAAFETTLRVVRAESSREVLLTLLEAFVYSPLTEWVVEDSRRAGKSVDLKARLEVNVNLSLFLSRAEERRQDATAFGAELSSCVRELQSVLRAAKSQLRPVLDEQQELRSIMEKIESAELALSLVEPQAQDGEATIATKQTDVQAKRQRMDEVLAKLDAFGSDCLERHRQICAWRDRAISFRSIALDRHQSALAGPDAASFQVVYASICGLRGANGVVGVATELAADNLEALCSSVDASVARFRLGVQDAALALLPILIVYGQARDEMDEFLRSRGCVSDDIYSSWRSQTAKVLHAAQSKLSVDATDAIIGSSPLPDNGKALSAESVTESRAVLSQLERIQARFGFDPSEYGQLVLTDAGLPSKEEASQVVDEIGRLVGAMKVSNAQSQRILKLASASWIVGAMESHGGDEDRSSVLCGSGSDTLTQHPAFRRLVVHAKTCLMLLELVSTSKGAVKRLRAADLISGRAAVDRSHTSSGMAAALGSAIGLLTTVEQLHAVAQEKLMLMASTPQASTLPEDTHLDALLAIKVATQDSQACRDLVLGGDDSPLLDKWPALKDVVRAVAGVVKQWAAWRSTLQEQLIKAFADADETNAVAKYWLELVVEMFKPGMAMVDNQQRSSQLEGASATMGLRIDEFVRERVAPTFQCVLSTIVAREWKIPFDPHQGESSDQPLADRWAAFMADHVHECFPLSTLEGEMAGCDSTTSRVHQLASKVVQLADLASPSWVRDWVEQQCDQRVARLASTRKLHAGRLRYATWLSQETQVAAVGESHRAPSRLELLASLSAQVPRLNALSVELQRLEGSVLELAQQLEYVASQQEPNASLSVHERIQDCYTKLSGLFSYVRELCDLVQGVTVVETSMRDALPALGGGVELQVDTVGRSLVEAARVAVLAWREAQLQFDDMERSTKKLQQTLDRKKAERNQLVAAESVCRASILQHCESVKTSIVDSARRLRAGGDRLLALLMAFDKPRNSSRHPIPGGHRDGGAASSPSLSASSSQSNADTTSSDASKLSRPESSPSRSAGSCSLEVVGGMPSPGFSFVENERLAKILLRSIRSVTRIGTLEGVLEKHERCFTALRGAIGRLELSTRELVVETDRVLSTASLELGGAESDPSAVLRSSFLAITVGSATAAPSPSVPDIDADAELLELVDALVAYMESLGEPLTAREAFIRSAGDTEAVGGGDTSMLELGDQLVTQSLKLFFDATDMANKLSSASHSQPKRQDAEADDSADDSSAGPTASVSGTRMPSASGESTTDTDAALDQLDEHTGSQASASTPAQAVAGATDAATTTQARSRYGLQVLSRIEDKLSGVCPDAGVRGTGVLTVEQQASWLIDEATKVDNLCVMYEGWTPWI